MEATMTEREKMLAGELYDCGDPELLTQWHKAKDLARTYNQTNSAQADEKERILSELLGGKGNNLWITAPFYVDYPAGGKATRRIRLTGTTRNIVKSGGMNGKSSRTAIWKPMTARSVWTCVPMPDSL